MMSIKRIANYPMPAAAHFPANKTHWQPDPAQAVLLIHDMQQYFLDFYPPDSPLILTLTEHLQQLRQWADQHRIPVVYTAQPHQQTAAERGLLNDVWGAGITAAPAEKQHIVPTLTPRTTDIVLPKWRYSAFQRSDLLQRMQNWQRKQLIIGGVYAHIGCMVTATEAFMQDIQVFFAGDAMADFSEQDHHYALNYVASCCGQVTTTAVLTQTTHGLSRQWLEQRIQKLVELEAEQLDPEENLILYGLDSLRIMQLAAELKQSGIEVGFEELGRQPTVNGWWQLIQARQAAKP